MSTIRKQSIIASFVVYIGFALGFFNTFLFTRQGGFTKEQYGLIAVFTAAAQLMYSVANLGMTAFITKFFPYYKAHVPAKKNDQLTIALLVPLAGFLLVAILGLAFKGILVNRIFSNSPELPEHYYWLFPFGIGYSLFMILDAYAWQLHKAVLSNFLKEVMFRAFVTVLITLATFGFIASFKTFIGIYSFVYVALVIYLFFHLGRQGYLHFSFQRSIVTRKFRKKILTLIGFVWSGGLIFSLASIVDTIFVAAILPNGMGAAGVFTFGQYIASLIQAPQRAVIAASTGPLSQAWKDKDFHRLNKIYHRSSINMLLFSCAMFCLVWINFDDAIKTFHLQDAYTAAKWVFFWFGITRIIDMGTGLNAQIVSTSTYWRFEFMTGLILLALMLPLNFFLTRDLGMVGPAIANLISFVIYNGIRYVFLLRKFNMQPFDAKTAYAILISVVCFLLAYWPFKNFYGLQWMIVRSLVFCIPFGAAMIWLKLSPDAIPVWQTVKKRLGLTRELAN
ncbi:lipopolysaccharide biosynthesis protein [Flavisolibacter ginsenosidimutans]|uniref:Lipopolysaccharide biosynthesis protein n=1 Tax=Flavisolibacter ginsenosidimutans TaxID=661481 RepID=A0A5B8UG33_9BACT|nr:polysaccharide biosynthesis C-terminal domain-containing protein [Flavisolibacter ginsenosidimutans]QEC55060.1 lipopolysaccharide biosynthesis protein [Flavisolibacter ginsenosidimutans]